MLPPDEILKKLGLKQGDIVADIGCGIGYFSIPAAEIVGQKGTVYGLDIEIEMVKEVERRAIEHNILNIRAMVTGEYDFKLQDASVSKALACLVLHEVEDKKRFLKEANRILKPGSSLAIVEWIKKNTDWGPPINHRLEGDNVKNVLQNFGFKEMNCFELNDYFYILTAVK